MPTTSTPGRHYNSAYRKTSFMRGGEGYFAIYIKQLPLLYIS